MKGTVGEILIASPFEDVQFRFAMTPFKHVSDQ